MGRPSGASALRARPARSTGRPRAAVVNVSQRMTLDRSFLTEQAGTLPRRLQSSVDEGLRLLLQL